MNRYINYIIIIHCKFYDKNILNMPFFMSKSYKCYFNKSTSIRVTNKLDISFAIISLLSTSAHGKAGKCSKKNQESA